MENVWQRTQRQNREKTHPQLGWPFSNHRLTPKRSLQVRRTERKAHPQDMERDPPKNVLQLEPSRRHTS